MSDDEPNGPASNGDDGADGLACDGGDDPDPDTPGDGTGGSDGLADGTGESDAPADETGESDATGDGTRESDAPAGESPLSDLARRASQRGDRADDRTQEDHDSAGSEGSTLDFDAAFSEGPPPDSDEDPFDRMSVEEIDEETLWSSLGSDDTASVGVGADVDVTPADSAGTLGDVDPVPEPGSVDDDGATPETHVVPKTKYCQSCPYFEDPPKLACTHEGTEIVEVVDSDRFRVRNCPMVDRGVEPDG